MLLPWTLAAISSLENKLDQLRIKGEGFHGYHVLLSGVDFGGYHIVELPRFRGIAARLNARTNYAIEGLYGRVRGFCLPFGARCLGIEIQGSRMGAWGSGLGIGILGLWFRDG